MPIHTTIKERTLRRSFREKKPGRHGLTVIDTDLPQFGFTVAKDGTKTFFVRALRRLGAANTAIPRAQEWAASTLACLSSDEFVDYEAVA